MAYIKREEQLEMARAAAQRVAAVVTEKTGAVVKTQAGRMGDGGYEVKVYAELQRDDFGRAIGDARIIVRALGYHCGTRVYPLRADGTFNEAKAVEAAVAIVESGRAKNAQ